jgi:hypothetical protein
MRFLRVLAAALAAVCVFAAPAGARLLIEIDKSAQRMTVSQDGARLYSWPVSTGVRAHDTPGGTYTPFRMEKDHFSREWDDAPMPHSIFFTRQGHAIHGTEHTRNIGRPASHGCVRLAPENARVLFGMVKQEGLGNVRVVLSGTVPGANGPAMVRRAPQVNQPAAYDDGYSTAPTRGVEREPVYRPNPWQAPDPYERGYRVPPQQQPYYMGPRY